MTARLAERPMHTPDLGELSERQLKDARSDLIMETLDEGDLAEILDGHSAAEMVPILRRLRLSNRDRDAAIADLTDYLQSVVGAYFDANSHLIEERAERDMQAIA